MSIFSKLLGNSKDLKLMELVSGLAEKGNSSLTCLEQLLTEYDNDDVVKTCCFRIQNLENEGDELVQQIIELLNEISITSWVSHEMVLRLIHVLDDILDNSQSIVRYLENYRLSKVTNEMVLLGKILREGGSELVAMMSLFCCANWQKNTSSILVHIRKIRDLEHQGDFLKAQGLHTLLNLDDGGRALTMRDLAEFRSSEKMLETLELMTDYLHLSSSVVHQCFSD